MAEQALAGMKVLDLTHYIAGPFCTKILADYGADVTKVERLGKGDGARQVGPFPGDIPDPEKSGLFLYLNTNKKGITLNLKTKTGIEILKKLVRESDVLVENFSPRVMPSLGLDYQTLKKINPQLVMTSISNFGQTGPYRDWKATEITLFALCGHMNIMGDPDREPLKYALNAYQYFAGETASLVTIAAAMRSLTTGDAEYIDISILETMVGDVNNRIYYYDYSGEKGTRTTAMNYAVYLYGGFPARDGYVCIQGGVHGEKSMPRLFTMIGKPELKDDPRFSTRENRLKHTDEFNALLYPWLIDQTKQEIFDEAAKARYPVAPVYNTEELLNNPHYREREFFVDIEHPRAGKLTYPGAPFKMSGGGYAIRRPAPLLGQHNKEVYCGLLGYSEYDLSTLRSSGVI
ncbi:MAG: CoA transferase [Dehalococcoidales bacterium]|nr:CoA transferase [Dehalococcoidales bacterium]